MAAFITYFILLLLWSHCLIQIFAAPSETETEVPSENEKQGGRCNPGYCWIQGGGCRPCGGGGGGGQNCGYGQCWSNGRCGPCGGAGIGK